MTTRRIAEKPRKFWTADEDARLVVAWEDVKAGTRTARQVAAEFPDRTLTAIRKRAAGLNVAGEKTRTKLPEGWQKNFRDWHALGWTDGDIAQATGLCRRHISFLRKSIGLASNAMSDKRREAVRQKTAEQLASCGCRSIGELRAKRFQAFAVSLGWPADLRVRGVQIVELLLREPALNRRQISDMIGMPWKGSRKSLVSNDPEGSYLANLMTRGLVIRSPRVYVSKETGKRKGVGKGVRYYSASPLAHEIKSKFLLTQVQGSHSQGSGIHGDGNDVIDDGGDSGESTERKPVATAEAGG